MRSLVLFIIFLIYPVFVDCFCVVNFNKAYAGCTFSSSNSRTSLLMERFSRVKAKILLREHPKLTKVQIIEILSILSQAEENKNIQYSEEQSASKFSIHAANYAG